MPLHAVRRSLHSTVAPCTSHRTARASTSIAIMESRLLALSLRWLGSWQVPARRAQQPDEPSLACPACGEPHAAIDAVNILDMTATVICPRCSRTSFDVPVPVISSPRPLPMASRR
jgi:hypothetical protein